MLCYSIHALDLTLRNSIITYVHTYIAFLPTTHIYEADGKLLHY